MTDPFADLKTMADMMRSADRIRKVSGDAGEFFAVLLVVDLEKLERSLLDGLKAYEKVCEEYPRDKPPIDVTPVHDKVALLNCLMKFRDDVAANTDVGRKTKAKFEEMNKAMNIN